MKRWLMGAVLASASFAGSAALPEQPAELYREGELLLMFRDGADSAPAHALRTELGLVSRQRLLRGRAERVELPAFTTVAATLALLRPRPEIQYAEPNFRRFRRAPPVTLPSDEHFHHQWGLLNTGQDNFFPGGPGGTEGGDLNLIAAWDPDGDGSFPRTGDGSGIVAVVDDGFETTHPDFGDNFITGKHFRRNRPPGNDVQPSNSEQVHGTLVAGCIGAVGNNSLGVAGVAWDVQLMPLKFDFFVSSGVAAFEYAAEHGAKVVNASYGGPGFSAIELEAILALADAGVLLVTAAGNDDSNIDKSVASYPANYDAPNIVSVAATNRQDGVASYSQYGPVSVDVAAPGLQIVTTAVGGAYSLPANCSLAGGSCGVTGTSFSSPYAAGVAALILMHANPDASPLELRARLIEGADPGLEAGNPVNRRVAGGRINAASSLDLAPRPSLVIRDVRIADDNGRLDPGETVDVEIDVENLWVDATNVSATLAESDPAVTVLSGAQALGAVAGDAAQVVTATFSVSVDAGLTDHREVFFTLHLTASGGYAATRSFSEEIAELQNDVTATEAWQAGDNLYDEFHTWHFDVPALPEGHNALRVETASGDDIDLLVKRGAPAEYHITLGVPPQDAVFDTDADVVSASAGGDESVLIKNPVAGSTYYITVVNYDQVAGGGYTLRAFTFERPAGGGGGSPGILTAALLLLAAAGRRLTGARS